MHVAKGLADDIPVYILGAFTCLRTVVVSQALSIENEEPLSHCLWAKSGRGQEVKCIGRGRDGKWDAGKRDVGGEKERKGGRRVYGSSHCACWAGLVHPAIVYDLLGGPLSCLP